VASIRLVYCLRCAVTVSALKRQSVPRNGHTYYLAIAHVTRGYEQHGWRLMPVPSNYDLRYVCKKGFPAYADVFDLKTSS